MEMHTREKENAVRELACFCYFSYDFVKRVVCLNHRAGALFPGFGGGEKGKAPWVRG